MATKIGYVSTPPDQQINWAEVGSNFSTMLSEEARVRDEKKKEIDRATREQMRVLNDAPTGDSKNVNEWALNFSSEAQNQLLMANKLLKSGKLKPRDYTLLRQNLADGTDQAFTLIQAYQDEYASKMERMKSDNPDASSQELETYLMETVEGFGNFSKSQLVIDPTTGRVMVGFKNPETGEIESDPNKLVGINNLNNRIKAKYDKYNMDAAVLKAKGTFGKFESMAREIGSKGKAGVIIQFSDQMMRSDESIKELIKAGKLTAEQGALLATYDKAEDAWLESQLSTYNTTSLLTDNLRNIGGRAFKYTMNPAEQDENTILLKQVDGQVVPDFESEIGKKQREIAKDGLKTVLRGALDHTEKVSTVNDYTSPNYAPQYVYEAGKDRKQEDAMVGAWGILYNGTQEEKDAAAQTLLGTQRAKDQGLVNITSDGSTVSLFYDGSGSVSKGKESTRTIPIIDPNTKEVIPFRNFAASGNELHGVDDVNRAVKAAGSSANNPYTSYGASAKRTTTEPPKPMNPLEKLDVFIEQNKPSIANFGDDNGDKLATELSKSYGSLGFTFKESWSDDEIVIKAPGKDGVEEKFEYDAGTPEGKRAQLDAIVAFVKGNTLTATDNDLLKLNTLQVTTAP
jgi:hypothetical protein